jgi:hypothetical protein
MRLSILTATCAALVAAGVSAGAAYMGREQVTISYDHQGVTEASRTNIPVYVHQTTADVRASGGMPLAYGRWSPTWEDMFVAKNSPVYGRVSAPAARRHLAARAN